MSSRCCVADHGCFIPDPNIFSSRIPVPDPNIFSLRILNKKRGTGTKLAYNFLPIYGSQEQVLVVLIQ
jgi:hypothetical protein